MALYLGNNKVSMKSGYTTTGLKEFLENGGKFAYSNYTDLTGILKYSDTENVTIMDYMFYSCNKLTNIPILNTSKVTRMYSMFYSCEKLISINQLDTSNVINMVNMFAYCSNLTSITSLNTSKVTNMDYMFQNCFILTTIPQLDTSKVVTMQYMFFNCYALKTIPNLDVSNVNKMGYMFYNCSNLTEIHMTGIKASFDIHNSTKFTKEALVEILNNLATVTSTQTLTMGSTNLAKLTDEDKAIATNKGWTLA